MDYSEMNRGSWAEYLVRFKNLVRPATVDPMSDPDPGDAAAQNVETVRSDESAKMQVQKLTDVLPNLVFEGYQDWYGYEAEWVLRNLGHVLTPADEDEILRLLDQGTQDSLKEALTYLVDQLDGWQEAAQREFTAPAAGATSGEASSASELKGERNTANWTARRTPGTCYYTYADGAYLYSDIESGPRAAWATLTEREDQAEAGKAAWGERGWYTPVGSQFVDLYGGAYVFRVGADGPWLTEQEATKSIQAADVQTVATQLSDEIEAELEAALAAVNAEDRERVLAETIANFLAE